MTSPSSSGAVTSCRRGTSPSHVDRRLPMRAAAGSRREEARMTGRHLEGVRAGAEVGLRTVEGRSRANQILRRRTRSAAVSPARRGRPRVSLQGLGREWLAYCGDDHASPRGERSEPRGWHHRRRIRRISLAEPAPPDDTLHLDIEVLEYGLPSRAPIRKPDPRWRGVDRHRTSSLSGQR
jgi:hypothetical protein